MTMRLDDEQAAEDDVVTMLRIARAVLRDVRTGRLSPTPRSAREIDALRVELDAIARASAPPDQPRLRVVR
jgi:hypothetical protein